MRTNIDIERRSPPRRRKTHGLKSKRQIVDKALELLVVRSRKGDIPSGIRSGIWKGDPSQCGETELIWVDSSV